MDLAYTAKQYYVFWHKMLGYPGIHTATDLIREFTRNRRLEFGKYRGRHVADIIMADRQYIQWCIDNVPAFKLTAEENALFKAGTDGCRIGGYTSEIIGDTCYSYETPGDTYDAEFIESAIAAIKKTK